jgi:PAS domain-containing protein
MHGLRTNSVDAPASAVNAGAALTASGVWIAHQDRELRYTWLGSPVVDDAEVLGHTDAELFSDVDAGRLHELKQRVLATGVARTRELALSAIKGAPRIFEVTAAPILGPGGDVQGVASALVDVTERRLGEEAARESERRLRIAVEGLAQAVALVDARGRVLTANAVARRLLPIRLQEPTGLSELDPGWPELDAEGAPLPASEGPVARVVRTGRAERGRRVASRDAHGDLRALSVDATPVPPDEPDPWGVVLSVTDAEGDRTTG